MKDTRLVDNSRRFYARLIRLYPQAHVTEYGAAMLQVFTDQCREAFRERGSIGLLFLWLRTLLDLGKTVLDEHLQAQGPNAGWSEISPLPWKEVMPALLPGLLALFIYAAGIIWMKWSYYQVFEWLAYASAIPVIWVWRRTKSFPTWGLVPAGLILFFTFENIYSLPYSLSGNYTLNWFLVTGFFVVLIAALSWRLIRQVRLPRAGYFWLGLCLLATFIQVGLMLVYNVKVYRWELGFQVSENARNSLMLPPLNAMEDTLGLLLFITCTALLSRKYGNLAVLFLLGFIFTRDLYGVYAGQAIIYPLAIAYRLLVTLVLPLWVMRAASNRGRLQGIAIPIGLAILIQMLLESGVQTGFLNDWTFSGHGALYPAFLVAYAIFKAISFAAGFTLAIFLCQAIRPSMTGSLEDTRKLPGDDALSVENRFS